MLNVWVQKSLILNRTSVALKFSLQSCRAGWSVGAEAEMSWSSLKGSNVLKLIAIIACRCVLWCTQCVFVCVCMWHQLCQEAQDCKCLWSSTEPCCCVNASCAGIFFFWAQPQMRKIPNTPCLDKDTLHAWKVLVETRRDFENWKEKSTKQYCSQSTWENQ